jgi:amino acid adenylation domain-containing protein
MSIPTGSSILEGKVVPTPPMTLVDAVADHAQSQPDALALEGDGEQRTYGELWADTTRIAGALAEAGVSSGDQVAIWATRTAPVVASALAAMALGAGYVPIDPTYPPARVRRILEVAKPVVIVCADAELVAGSVPDGVAIVESHDGPTTPTPLVLAAKDSAIAYTVFTSGSTGLPKGVLVTHGALRNYLEWARTLTNFSPTDATPCFASLGFDHAVTCLWLPLWVGGSVQLIPDSWDPRPWLVERSKPFAFIKITPSHVRLFERIAKPDYKAITRCLMFGGERLDAALVAGLGDRVDGIKLLNHYGPTEATVGCSAFTFTNNEIPTEGVLPIGVPVDNSSVYLIDETSSPVALGEEGELVFTGACVAAGYVGGDAKDAARFTTAMKIGASAPARAYRTGDRAVIRDGQINYLGRQDEQVKVRGHRIEIQEVHDVALSVPGVAQVAITLMASGLGGLELFVVPEANAEGVVARVVERCRAELPAAAVPERVRLVTKLVVNVHGKWDPQATRELAEQIAANNKGAAS